ncbi:MAG: metallophosphoesterase [Pseudomonadota bacterium]|nr:metallophosphoesterase [Pseudomonadota bacterium]
MLLHLSDLHFGTEQPAVCQAIQRLCAQRRPEAVVVSGDLTQRAKEEQFVAASQFLHSLNCPLVVVAGNHDIPLFHFSRRMLRPYAYFHRYFGTLEPTLETANFTLIGVNSIARHHHTQGSVSTLQIWQAGERLRQAVNNKAKLVISHQPFAVSSAVDQDEIPRLMPRAMQHWSRFGLSGLLHGHLHVPAVFDLNQQLELGVSHPILDIQAGTATSSRLRQGYPNSINWIYPDLQVERLDFSPVLGGFFSVGMLWP